LYDRLFTVPNPDEAEGDYRQHLNPQSLVVMNNAYVEPGVRDDAPGTRYQFERVGFFCSDEIDSSADRLVFNRTVTLRDSWAKVSGAQKVDEGRPQRKQATSRAKAPPPKARELSETGRRYVAQQGLAEIEADVLSRDPVIARFFETAVAAGADARSVAKWLINELPRELNGRTMDELPFTPAQFAALVMLIDAGVISGAAGKEVLAVMASEGGSPEQIVEQRGLKQISDPKELAPVVRELLKTNADKANAYRSGKTGLLGFFVGQAMAKTGGRANPEMIKNLVEELLAKG
jgi:glutaminyl-tRNA synthetase